MEMLSFTIRAATWRLGEGIRAQVRKAMTGTLSDIRFRRRDDRNGIRVSRLSDDWLRKHERESAKHDPAVR